MHCTAPAHPDVDLRLDRWNRIDLPVLRELAKAAESDTGTALLDTITERLDVPLRDVMKSFDTLRRTDFVDARFTHDNGGEYFSIQLSEKGLRATELWPTTETGLNRMITALEAIAADSDEDHDTRGRAKQILDSLKGAGREIGIVLVTAMLTGRIPGPS